EAVPLQPILEIEIRVDERAIADKVPVAEIERLEEDALSRRDMPLRPAIPRQTHHFVLFLIRLHAEYQRRPFVDTRYSMALACREPGKAPVLVGYRGAPIVAVAPSVRGQHERAGAALCVERGAVKSVVRVARVMIDRVDGPFESQMPPDRRGPLHLTE